MKSSPKSPALPMGLKWRDVLPWLDRGGRFSLLRAVTFAAGVLPGFWIIDAIVSGKLMAEPYKQATHLTGEWALYFLLATLAVSPLKRLLAMPKLAGIRRMLGLIAFAYAFSHLLLYIFDQNWDLLRVASEIVSRIYLTIGFVAVLGFAVLAATSFDAAIRKLGRNWKRLHRLTYPLVALGMLHFFMQSKLEVAEAVLLSGIFCGLMFYRLAERLPLRLPDLLLVPVVAVLAGAAAAGLEYGWYAVATGVPAERVFMSNFMLEYQPRPALYVIGIMLLPLPVMLLAYLWSWAKLRLAARLSQRDNTATAEG